MALHVNANLALRLVHDEAKRLDAPQRDPRAQLAAQFIPAGARILDLGHGGGETLRDLVPFGCAYEAVDHLAHGKGSLIHGLTGAEFPTRAATESDIILMLGQLERVADLDGLFTHLRFCKQDVIVSYCPADLPGGAARAARGFANHLVYADLIRLFDRYGFRIECTAPVSDVEMMFRLTPGGRVAPVAACDVAVVSESDAASFGDRLGVQLVNGLLPGEARIHHMTFAALRESPPRRARATISSSSASATPCSSR